MPASLNDARRNHFQALLVTVPEIKGQFNERAKQILNRLGGIKFFLECDDRQKAETMFPDVKESLIAFCDATLSLEYGDEEDILDAIFYDWNNNPEGRKNMARQAIRQIKKDKAFLENVKNYRALVEKLECTAASIGGFMQESEQIL